MLKLKKTSSVIGDQRSTNNRFIPSALVDQLDGMSLYDAQNNGIIDVIKFQEMETTYHGNDGTETHSRVVMVTDKGDIIVSEGLAAELKSWEDRLGDLQLKKGISKENREFFRLQRPGGGVSVSRTDLAVGEVVDAADQAAG